MPAKPEIDRYRYLYSALFKSSLIKRVKENTIKRAESPCIELVSKVRNVATMNKINLKNFKVKFPELSKKRRTRKVEAQSDRTADAKLVFPKKENTWLFCDHFIGSNPKN
jgi:hypothetical protein